MKSSKQIKKELEEEKARYEFLKNKKDELEKELSNIEQELKGYRHSHYSWGKIQCKEYELEKTKLIEESESLPIAVFHSGNIDENYRIFKVTPKRIYIRRLNKEALTISEDFINRDGSGCWQFNIAETLKAWEKYKGNSNE